MTDTESGRTPVPGSGGAVADSPSASAVAPAAAAASTRGSGALWFIALAALAIALVAAGWSVQRFAQIESTLAQRLQAQEQKAAGLDAMLRSTSDLMRDLQGRASVLESKAVENAALQAQIEKLFRERAEDSLDVMLAEIEAVLGLAAQQLALGADVGMVLAALQNLDGRIARQNDPRLGALRAALLKDVERLRLFPAADSSTLAIRIDALLSAIDKLPLLNALQPRAEAVDASNGGGALPAGGAPAEGSGWEALLPERLRLSITAMGREFGDLFRVRRIDEPDALLVSPQQEYFLRQNLRLVLLNARLALLSRNEAVFRADLDRARRWIDTYYDGEHRNVSAVRSQVDQLLAARLALEPPRIDESVGAVRLMRSASR